MICLVHMKREELTLKMCSWIEKIIFLWKTKINSLSNIIKPFFDLNFFLIIVILLFGLLILTSASIDLSSKKL